MTLSLKHCAHRRAFPPLAGAIIAAIAIAAPANAGAYLPDASALPKAVNAIDPQTGSNHIIREYVGGKQNYNQQVNRPDGDGAKLGNLTFQFAGYKGRRNGDPAGANTIGGAAIRGGFKFNEGFMVNNGWNLRWLQVFNEQPANTNTVDGNDFYPIFGIAGIDIDLFDVPFDLLTTNISVTFESTLVVVDKNNANNVEYIGSFLWGYTINGGVVTTLKPQLWGAPTQNFINTVTTKFPNINLTESSAHIKVPAPGSLFCLSLCLLTVTRRRRAA